MEKFIYEIRPYFFLAGGLAAMAYRTDKLMLVCGMMLIIGSALIIRDRLKHRAWLAS